MGQVNNLMSKLQQTPPFLSQPVILAYTPFGPQLPGCEDHCRSSCLEPRTGFADSLTISGSADSTGDGIGGVLANDQIGTERPPACVAGGRCTALGRLERIYRPGISRIATLRRTCCCSKGGSVSDPERIDDDSDRLCPARRRSRRAEGGTFGFSPILGSAVPDAARTTFVTNSRREGTAVAD